MRYYDISITDADGKLFRKYTSYPNGATDTGALDIEFDVSVTGMDAPINSQQYVKIFGIPLSDMGQASDFNGKFISMMAGMKKGLPLANPAQAGQIFTGSIFFAFGNWQGTAQSLDLIINAVTPSPTAAAPNNIVFHWVRNTSMADALAATFSGAWPTMKQSINIAPNLISPTTILQYCKDIEELGTFIKKLSLDILGGASSYPGVSIAVINGVITAYDATPPKDTASQQGAQAMPTQINFTDLIGQPTWLGVQQLSTTLVMRGDLKVGTFIKMPAGLQPLQTTTTAAAYPGQANKSVFQGTFLLSSLRHVGRFRQPSASSWVTVATTFLQS